jgi:hypothetical protein
MRTGSVLTAALTALLAAAVLTAVAPPDDEPASRAIAKLREKLNPEYVSWSPEEVYERVAEDLAAFQAKLVAESGATDGRPLAEARRYAAKEASYRIYFDFSDVPRGIHPQGIAALFFAANSSSTAPFTYRPKPVRNTDNRIYYADFRLFRWSDRVLEKISEEDPYYREPLISSASKALQFVKATIGNKVLRAGWFVYYNGDTTEFLDKGETKADNAFYYQLVYGSNEVEKEVDEDYDVKVTETYTVYEQREVLVDYGHYRRYEYRSYPVEKTRSRLVTRTRTVRKAFPGAVPQNAREFQKFWRIDSALRDAADFFADRGAVIDEDRSQVSYSNRIIQRVRTNLGTYTRTFDVFRTAGNQDFLETLPVPLRDKITFDAGEHIFQDSKGAQHYFLTAGKKEDRVEFGDPRVVRDQNSGHRLIVTTWKSCVSCHEQGLIPLQNEVEAIVKSGVRLNVRVDKFVEKNAFFLQDVNRLLKIDNDHYAEFVRECNGLTPQENARQYQRFRQWYAAPVGLEQAARECGAPVEEFKDAISVTTKGRVGRLLTDGRSIPRFTWERGLYQEAFLLLIEYRKAVNVDRKSRDLEPIPLTRHAGSLPLKRDR